MGCLAAVCPGRCPGLLSGTAYGVLSSLWDCAGNGGSFEQHESWHSLRSLEAVPPYRWPRAFKVSQGHSRLFKLIQPYSRVFGKVFFLFLWRGASASAHMGETVPDDENLPSLAKASQGTPSHSKGPPQ